MTAPHEEYRLEFEPDGTSWTARENLVDVLERELLGPANGPEEILDGPPDVAYLVGRIAPARLACGKDDPGEEGAGEAATDVGDAVAAREGRGVPVADDDEAGAGADEDAGAQGSSAREDIPQQRGLMIPASMGLRCQVPADLAELSVLAEWGTYRALGRDVDGKGGSRRYQRTDVKITAKLQLAEFRVGQTGTEPLQGDVVLRVDVHPDGPDRRIVELALCNDRETPRTIPIDAWLYQTRLTVTAGDVAVFLPVRDVLAARSLETDVELRRLELQYATGWSSQSGVRARSTGPSLRARGGRR